MSKPITLKLTKNQFEHVSKRATAAEAARIEAVHAAEIFQREQQAYGDLITELALSGGLADGMQFGKVESRKEGKSFLLILHPVTEATPIDSVKDSDKEAKSA